MARQTPTGTGAHFASAVAAGLAGTIVYTVLSRWEKGRLGRGSTVRPVDVLAPAGGTGAVRRAADAAMHWGYGAWGGLLRAGLDGRGLARPAADVAHLAAFWLPWRLLVLAGGAGRPGPGRRELALDAVNHAVYVAVVGTVYSRLARLVKAHRPAAPDRR